MQPVLLGTRREAHGPPGGISAPLLRGLVCPGFCRYHKPGKSENPGCGGIEFLARSGGDGLLPLASLLDPTGSALFGLDDDPRLADICRECAFLRGGCDFRDPSVPRADCAPCGGLRAAAGLFASGWTP